MAENILRHQFLVISLHRNQNNNSIYTNLKITTIMEKKENKGAANVATGFSAAVGGAVGVVGGTFASDEIHAAEVQTPELPQDETADDDVPVVDSDPSNPQTAQEPAPAQNDEYTGPVEVEPQPAPEPQPVTPASDQTADVQVLDYQQVTGPDGQPMDAALVSVNGESVAVLDTDHNGIADTMVCDANHNGQIDEGEVVDVSGQGIAMSDLEAAAHGAGADAMYAQNDMSGDYDNNANVGEYMA